MLSLSYFRLPQTSTLRVPRHKERVYSISVNGSPIAAGNEDIVINIPSSNGEVSVWRDGALQASVWGIILTRVFTQSLQLLASQINTVDLSQLDQTAVRSIRLLQVPGPHPRILHCFHTQIQFRYKF